MAKNMRGKIENDGYSRRSSDNLTYDEYLNSEEDKVWRRRIDEEYAYRQALEAKFRIKNINEEKKAVEAMQKFQANLQRKYALEADKQQRTLRKQALEEYKKQGTLTAEEKQEYKQIVKDERTEKFAEDVKKSFKEAVSSLGNVLKSYVSKVDNYISVFNDYAAGITTRLQGSDKTFETISDVISGKLAGSPIVKQTTVLTKLNELVSSGINYNVEQRAFLAAITDEMVQTFDVANSTLLRIIRLQQADSTIARMGMESILNKYLNSVYQDTSYLTDVYDSIEASLVDAISQLGTEAGVQFEYIAQKWFGSLYSVGMDSGTLSSIAQGINYLASGNVSALSSNNALQNLLLMGANTSGLNYGQMLQGGFTANDLNKLLAGVVSYAQGIANTDNLVVKNAYAQLFGLTMSDLTALRQMGDDLSYIIKETISYSDALTETSNQLDTLNQRLPLAKRISNVFDNVMASAAEGIANNTGTYVTWLIANLVEEATGGINIPSIMSFGTGINLNATVTQLMKTGIAGAGLLGKIGSIFSNLNNSNAASLYGWGESAYTTRGTGFTGIRAGSQETVSQSLTVGTSSGEDIASSSITTAKTQAAEQVSGQSAEERDMIETINKNVSTLAGILQAVFDSNALRVKVLDYGLTTSVVDSSKL